MIADEPRTVAPPRSGEELRREFRMAQRRRLVKRGVAQWRDDDGDRPSPEPTSVVPVDEVD